MSYHIIHDKQFIKVKDRFICMQLGGDNNLVDAFTGKTSRSWYAVNFNGTILATREDILKDIENTRERHIDGEHTNDDNFIWAVGLRMGGRQTFNQYKSFYLNGMKKAITLEQLKEVNESLVINFFHHYRDEVKEKDGVKSFTLIPQTEQEIINVFDTNKDKFDWIAPRFGWGSEDIAKRIRRKFFPRNRKNSSKELVSVDSYWTIMLDGTYFAKNGRNGGYYRSRFSPQIQLPKKQAEKKLKYLKDKHPNREYKLKEIKERANIYV